LCPPDLACCSAQGRELRRPMTRPQPLPNAKNRVDPCAFPPMPFFWRVEISRGGRSEASYLREIIFHYSGIIPSIVGRTAAIG
jgi:hypothetical protein